MKKTPLILNIPRRTLEQHLARLCSHYYKIPDGKELCNRVAPDECNIDMLEKMEWRCPPYCPHWTEHKWKECNPHMCRHIQNEIKEMTI